MKHSKIFALAILFSALISFSAGAQENATESLTLRNGGFEKRLWSLHFGYVNKSWICTYDSVTQREDFFGDPDDKYLHGIGFGGLFTPSFDWGLGLRTGLFLEAYNSRSKWITDWCHHFGELDLYIPLQATYRIPFTDECALDLLAGFGFQWAIDGSYYRRVGTAWQGWWRRPTPVYDSKKAEYGGGWPQKVNWQAEVGLNFRYKDFGVSFTYSFGLTDHGIQNSFDGGQTYVTALRSRQDKMQAMVMFYFD